MHRKPLPEFLKNKKIIVLSGAAIIVLLVLVIGYEFTALKELGRLNEGVAQVLAISFLVIMAATLFITGFNLNATKKREKAIEKRLRVSDTLINCITVLAEEHDINKSIDMLLKILNDYFDGDRAYLFEFDYVKQTTSNSYEYAAPGVTKEIDNLQDVSLEVIDSWIRKFEETGTFYISSINKDVDKQSDTYRILEMQQIESLIAVPLIEKDKIIGFLGIDNPKINYDDLSLLSSASFFILDGIERRESHALLQRLSFEDSLTGVYNRNKFNHTVSEMQRRELENVGVAYFDVNGLKAVNDTMGHHAGDELIKNASQGINSVFADETYRIGGDEFVVVSCGVEKAEFASRIGKVKALLDNKGISVSVGVCWSRKTENIEKQLSEADKLMYEEKNSLKETPYCST